jgi:carbon-monoxide dehydrogenase large subunit
VQANRHEVPLKSRHGSPFFLAPHPVLVVGKVRYVGKAVAVLVAETVSHATDASERSKSGQPLPAVTRSVDALASGAPLVWDEHGSNLCVDSEAGDQQATDAAFARAAHVVRLETAINPGHRCANGVARRRWCL